MEPNLLRRLVAGVLVVCTVTIVAVVGTVGPLDRLLADWRFSTDMRAASGETVFVEIDAAAIDGVGVWPWPRSVHAEVVSRLLDLGAYEIWMDIDFSTASAPEQDTAFAEALSAGGGYIYLAAFQRATETGSTHITFPLPQLRAHSDLFAVNVVADERGVVRAVPQAITDGEHVVPSLPTLLHGAASRNRLIHIDYGIDAATVPRVSVQDILDGSVGPAMIEGRHVVVGASALELQDFFFTPNQGHLAGALIQVLASESLLAGRNLTMLGQHWAIGALVLLAFLHVGLPIRGVVIRTGLLVIAAFAYEVIAAALYLRGALVLPSGAFHLGAAALIVFTLLQDTRLLSVLVSTIGGERDALKAMLEQVVNDNYDGVIVIDQTGSILTASRMATEFLGSKLIGASAEPVLPSAMAVSVTRLLKDPTLTDKSVQGQISLHATVGYRQVEYVLTRSTYGHNDTPVVTLTFRDITERLQHEKHLAFLAEHDPTTETLSRAGFLKRLDERFTADQAEALAIFVIEVARFKTITASLGHEAGDELLRQIADRLGAAEFEAIAHLGQGQFALAVSSDMDIRGYFDGIQKLTGATFDLFGHGAAVGFSAGYAAATKNERPQSVLRKAEIALIFAQGRPGSRLEIYDEVSGSRLSQNRRLESLLIKALKEKQFFLVFQPQYALKAAKLTGAEALVRWQREGEIVPPNAFLPVAEQTGLIVEMTRWILGEACRTAIHWPKGTRVAVNISALHFELGDLVADVKAALDESGLNPASLELEITETVNVGLREHIPEVLSQLRRMGVTIAIDDFGTGYSSLAYLDKLPFDLLKIDKTFIDGLTAVGGDYGVVPGIIGIARSMGKMVLAEGIEDEVQAEILKSLGCDLGQGYLFAKPMPAQDFLVRARDAA